MLQTAQRLGLLFHTKGLVEFNYPDTRDGQVKKFYAWTHVFLERPFKS